MQKKYFGCYFHVFLGCLDIVCALWFQVFLYFCFVKVHVLSALRPKLSNLETKIGHINLDTYL